ncbi:Pectin lyase fold/virulence factor [Apiospora marii]|uniref:Pectin lyase fold/virulence factor n=1 Tax=Apiospora marii TaxID=335849 RepID=UPI00312F08D5
MATPATAVVDHPHEEGENIIPPLASYEDLENDYWNPRMNRDVRRLRWSLDGPIAQAVSVMHHAYYDPEDPPPEPFYCSPANSDSDNEGPGTWHAVSQPSLYEPKVSSVTVDVSCLHNWAGGWDELHMDCDTLLWDEPSDEQLEDDDDQFSLSSSSTCYCGERPPWRFYDPLTIHASSTVEEGGGYVTIRDYVTAAHPWLQGLRELILTALSPDITGDYDVSADAKLMAMATGFSRKIDVLPWPTWLEYSRYNPLPEHSSPPRRYPPRPRPPTPPFVPVGGIDLSIVESNRNRPPPGLRDAHIWPGV